MSPAAAPTPRVIAAAAFLLAACAGATQHPYVAPNRTTILSSTEEREGMPAAHLIFVENRSTVPVTVFSVSLSGCENVKQQCAPHPMKLRVGPGARQMAIRVEPSDAARGFSYQFGFSWNADSAGVNALSALADNGDTRSQARLAALKRADSLDRAPRGPHYNELSRDDFAMLASRARRLRLSPDSLVLEPGARADLQQVRLLVVDSAGVVLGQTQWLRYQLPRAGAFGFAPPSTVIARSPGRAVIRFELADEAQQLLSAVPAEQIDLPVVVAFADDPHAPTFEGIAIDGDSRKPLGCTRVALEDSAQNVVATGRTDNEGVFFMRAPRAGSYAVRVEAHGWAPVSAPPEMARADEAKQHQYSVKFVDQLLMSPAAMGLDEVEHAYPVAVSAAPYGARAAKPVKGAAAPRLVVQSVSLRGSASMPILNIVGNARPGTSWIQFVVDSAGHVDAPSILFPSDADPLAIASVNLVLPHVRFSPAREARRPTCEMERMQVNFSPR